MRMDRPRGPAALSNQSLSRMLLKMKRRDVSVVRSSESEPLLIPEDPPEGGVQPSRCFGSYFRRGVTWITFLLLIALFARKRLLPFSEHRARNQLIDQLLLDDVVDALGASVAKGDQVQPNQRLQVRSKKGFPSFADYAGNSINVSYDSRSILINDERVLFLAGSLHPSRATAATWELALDQAVSNGLNMVTIYIMWSTHQPFSDQPVDWNLPASPNYRGSRTTESPSCRWDVAQAIRSAADRGLFVHIRLGPYVCAEYNYGGIPEWLPLKYPDMAMRRPNQQWYNVMEGFISKAVAYLRQHKLWANQGGPIVLAQIENELGGNMDFSSDHLVFMDSQNQIVTDKSQNVRDNSQFRNATLQDYADWCGDLAARLVPDVVWTMCFGLSANNTIVTYNGMKGDSWLEQHGSSGRIQVDQPAMWTEDEGGFQIWGDDAKHPSDYFWGQTARKMASHALRWFARGGTHLNYYMFFGGYNYARSAAAGIMNGYAFDAPVCPSGQTRQPKFGHFQALHEMIADIADVLLRSESALLKNETVSIMNDDGRWIDGPDQRMFVYQTSGPDSRKVVFVENDEDVSRVIKISSTHKNDEDKIFEMNRLSSVLLIDDVVLFDSSQIDPRAMSYRRRFDHQIATVLVRPPWKEPIGVDSTDPWARTTNRPLEQTALNVNGNFSSDYAWYETSFHTTAKLLSATLLVDTQKANAIVAFVDDAYVGASDEHHHAVGNSTLRIPIGKLDRGWHRLSVLSESLGYSNLIGRWGSGTKAKVKGLTGSVTLVSPQLETNMSLIDGRVWRSFPGLHGEKISTAVNSMRREHLETKLESGESPCSWTSLSFDTPYYDPKSESLFLDIPSGRGHLWLNGRDLGRYWNITNRKGEYSQRYYFLPSDYLNAYDELNEIVMFDVFGGDHRDARLVLSWMEATGDVHFQDEVDFPGACLR